AASAPVAIESWPRPGPTVRSSMIVSGAGSAPARSRIARSLAACTVKLPEICPEPPVIGSRITGAEITSLSSTMAKGCPTFSNVAWANLREPALLKRKLTIGSPERWSKPGWASVKSPPETSTCFLMTYGFFGEVELISYSDLGGTLPDYALSGVQGWSYVRYSNV